MIANGITITGLKKDRLTHDDNPTDQGKITLNGEMFLKGNTMAVIWNNIIGANSDTKKDHHNYMRFVTSQGLTSGKLCFITVNEDGSEVEVDSCDIDIKDYEIRLQHA